jgi:CBS domain-containing protein
MTANDIMSETPFCVALTTPIEKVARKLSDRNIGGVIVLDDEGMVAGILTQTDLLHRVAHPHLPPHVDILGNIIYLSAPHKVEEVMGKIAGATARDAMTHHLVTAPPETPVEDLADMMLEHRIGRIPIVVDGRPVGIVTRSDLIRRVVSGR